MAYIIMCRYAIECMIKSRGLTVGRVFEHNKRILIYVALYSIDWPMHMISAVLLALPSQTGRLHHIVL